MIIEIWTKKKYSANEETAFLGRLGRAGLKAGAARLSRLYRVDSALGRAEVEKLASGLLADPITENYSLVPGKTGFGGGWRVEVWLKDSVTDVVGESVKEAITGVLGKDPGAVRFGHAYYVACDSAVKLKHAVSKTLVNEIVNKFGIEKI
ncbi:MAG: hypothetical protein COT18_12875 [Elusimicrobia bacterium CG08_land_8_20_14_0_20_59_10]|nr:MAG: hypothetical protein COT18_12875 [Elusimicrobia bacterium CG08_land_8_20_14_0_20_59_10]